MDCPNQKVFTVVEESLEEDVTSYDNSIYDEDLDEDEEITYPDSGELLVIRRALNTNPSTSDDDWLRNNIFHTSCTSHGKACDVIIDSGSCENVVSKAMVDKLPLKVEKHPNPYKLSWLQKGNSIKVDQRCLVDFSIGKKISG